jgi:hypothetical protein
MFITFADLAKLKSVSRSAVAQKKQKGILKDAIVKVGNREMLNKDLALELWDKNTDPARGVVSVPVATPTKKELKEKVESLPNEAIPDFNKSRARKEHYLAELAKIQVAQQKKELMPVSEIKKTSFQLGRSIRESLANLADRLSNEIAGETDAQAIHKLLTDEHRTALEQLVEAS